jgi:hypothetical protein
MLGMNKNKEVLRKLRTEYHDPERKSPFGKFVLIIRTYSISLVMSCTNAVWQLIYY